MRMHASNHKWRERSANVFSENSMINDYVFNAFLLGTLWSPRLEQFGADFRLLLDAEP